MIGWLAGLLALATRNGRAAATAIQDSAGDVDLPFDKVTVPGERALAEWERLRSAGRGWPVIIGSDADLAAIAEQLSIADDLPGTAATTARIIEESEALRFPDSLRQLVGADGDAPPPPPGEWPEPGTVAPTGMTVASDILTGKPLARVHILLIPTTRSWEVPAYLRWGGWNACPPPAHQVAALKHWHARFGAELVGLNGDTLNLRAARLPATKEEALALAGEQYAFCPDIVDQGTGSLSALAATLMANRWWFLWWD